MQAETQLIEGDTAGAAVVAGALVMADDWARAPAANAMRATVYFIFTVESYDVIGEYGKTKVGLELE